MSGFVSFVVLWKSLIANFACFSVLSCGVFGWAPFYCQMVSHFYGHLEILKLRYGMIWLWDVYYYLYDVNVRCKQGDIKSGPREQVCFVVLQEYDGNE